MSLQVETVEQFQESIPPSAARSAALPLVAEVGQREPCLSRGSTTRGPRRPTKPFAAFDHDVGQSARFSYVVDAAGSGFDKCETAERVQHGLGVEGGHGLSDFGGGGDVFSWGW